MEICKEAWARDCEAEGEVVCTMEEDAGKINQYLISTLKYKTYLFPQYFNISMREGIP